MHEDTPELDEEAGSYSPQLIHGDENEEAIDPEEDRAVLVRTERFLCFLCRLSDYAKREI